MTQLGILLGLVSLAALFTRRGWMVALVAGACTPVGAALVSGSVAVPTFYAAALGAAAGLALKGLEAWRSPDPDRPRVPTARLLVLFVAVSVFVTMLAPVLFNGLGVPTPGGTVYLAAGVVTKSNIAQIAYLVLAVCVVLFVARSPQTGVWVVGVPAVVVVGLSLWAFVGKLGVPFPAGFFDNSPTFTFQETLPGGAPRVRGILSEPAGLATSALVMLGYGISRLRVARGAERPVLVAAVAAAAFLGLIASSATFYVAGLVVLVLGVLVAAGTFAVGGQASRTSLVLAAAGAAVAVVVLPALAALFSDVVQNKVGSASYDERGTVNADALALVWQTHGFGTGLGSTRASSFAATMLAAVGVVGTVVFVAVLVTLVRATWSDLSVRPATWALLSLLSCKLVSGPDLNDTSGVLWLTLGVLASSAVRSRQRLSRSAGSPAGEDAVPAPELPPTAAVGAHAAPAAAGTAQISSISPLRRASPAARAAHTARRAQVTASASTSQPSSRSRP